MWIEPKIVYRYLKSEGISSLYHANTLLTSIQFLNQNLLMSRWEVEEKGLPQTSQSSDDKDKKYGVWKSVFLDTIDIHKQGSRRNVYGPVLFVLDTKILLEYERLRITKTNPLYWKLKKKENWFQDIDEVDRDFIITEFQHMLVLSKRKRDFDLTHYLKEIVLDDPKRSLKSDKADIYSMAKGALKMAALQNRVNIKIAKRKCGYRCTCVKGYKQIAVGKDFKKMFFSAKF